MNAELDHDALSCPECQAMAAQARVLGGIAEAMERMLADGTFERLGAEMARRREEAILRAVFGPEVAP